VIRMYSVADQLPAGTPLIKHRPFRAPDRIEPKRTSPWALPWVQRWC